MVTKWFNEKGLSPYDYQVRVINNVLKSKKEKIVFAAAPNAGKTTMTICIIDLMKRENPNLRVLILTHNTIVLRNNFKKNLIKLGKPFSYQIFDGKKDINKNVVISLPATLYRRDLPEFDLIIVDEAHQYYEKKQKIDEGPSMVQTIIEKTKVKKQILLTGTPSPFIGRKDFDIQFVTGMEVYKSGNSANVNIEIATSRYFTKKSDYTQFGEIKDSYHFDDKITLITLDDVMSKITERISGETLGRTLIACKNSTQVRLINHYFNERGIKCAASIDSLDKKNKLIQEFEINQEYRVLIVIFRGILGFSDPTLENVIDLTLTTNINRMFQLYNRLTRKWGNTIKTFIKVTPQNQEQHYRVVLAGMVCMLDSEWFTKFNGRNFSKMRIPTKKVAVVNKDVVSENIQNTFEEMETEGLMLEENDFELINDEVIPMNNEDMSSGNSTILVSEVKTKRTKPRLPQGFIEQLQPMSPNEIFTEIESDNCNIYSPKFSTDMETIINQINQSMGNKINEYTYEMIEETYKSFSNKTLVELMMFNDPLVDSARTKGIHFDLIEKYNIITRENSRRTKSDITKFLKDNNINKQMDLRRMGREGMRVLEWLNRNPEIKDKLLPDTRVTKYTVEYIEQRIKEAADLGMSLYKYDFDCYNNYKVKKRKGLMR